MNPNRKIPKVLPLMILLFAALCYYRLMPGSPGAPPWTVAFSGSTMGTTYSVKVVGRNLNPSHKAGIEKAATAAMEAVNQSMSTYLKDSELSRFNAFNNTEPFALSAPILTVLKMAQDISELTHGQFDVTVGPLVNAWGFGPEGPKSDLSEEEIAALLVKVGFEKLTLSPETLSASKAHGEMYVDLSAIAKGYGVDQVGAAIEALGHENYMVEIGGEVLAKGLNGEDKPWRIGVETPSSEDRGIIEVVTLSSQAMATSGDYRNFFEKNGKRFSHTINPKTGRPVKHLLASVTVVADSCARADALATALNVLGPTAGLKLAEDHAIAALFIVREPSGELVEKQTSAFQNR